MAYDFEQARKYLSNEQIEAYLKEKGANEFQLQSQSPQDRSTLQQLSGGLKKVGEVAGDITGVTGAARAVGTALRPKTLGIVGKSLLGQEVPLEEFEGIPEVSAKEAAGSFGKLGLTVGTLGTPGLAAGVAGKIGLAARSLESGITGAAFQILDNLAKEKELTKGVGATAGIAAAIPVIGAGLRAVKQAAKPASEKIEMSLIRPTAPDIKDGFKIETISKYKLEGPLQDTLKKAQTQIDNLVEQLHGKIKSTDAVVDLNEIAKETAEELLGKGKAKAFGDVATIKKGLERLAVEVEEQSGNGLVGIPQAQAIKQAAGTKGSWVFGYRDPDSNATEAIYNTFYRIIRKKIEDKSPAGIKEINQKLSELIPVVNAVVRRIPVAERQNAISLTDIIAGGLAIGNASLGNVGLFIANRLSKSGSFAKFLSEIESKSAVTKIGQRIFGR